MASSSHVKQGEKGEITAKIGIKGRAGTIAKNIKVYSNDPKKPVITLSVTATIQK